MSWRVLAAHELRVEMRGRETIVPLLLTGVLVVTIGLLSFHEIDQREAIAGGVLWMGLAFASSLALSRAFGAEKDRGTLDTLLSLPVDRSAIYAAKVVAAFASVLLVALLVAPVYLLASGQGVPSGWASLLLILGLGSLGLAASGVTLSALTATARGRDALLPVLMLPLLIPLLVSTTDATQMILRGAPFADWRSSLFVLAGYDLAFLAASALLMDAAVGA